MGALGISVYPEHATLEMNQQYIRLARQYGFTRVFTCLISLGGDKEKKLKEFKELVQYANQLGMKVVADVSPIVFEEFQISLEDLVFFKDLGLYGIRLDLGFSGKEESMLTYNPYDLKIELNMSGGSKYLENIIAYQPNKNNLLGCHNFYPHRYTGLSRSHFLMTSKGFQSQGIRTCAFVSSSNATFGPWPVTEGLCTLEAHRDLPINVQAKDLFNTGVIEDIIIANAFASEEELQSLTKVDPKLLALSVEIEAVTPELERKIILDELHFNRGDVSDYMIRSTQSRIKYKTHHFEVFNPKPIKRGDILIESSLYGQYAGELQLALKDMNNSGKTNVVGRVSEEEVFLLDGIQPWQKFRICEA